jgi:toluene monooxygenase electron transfer component
LRGLPGFGSHLHFHPAVSEAGAGWEGETGFIHEVVKRRLSGEMDRFEFYLAGPPPMTQALLEMLPLEFRVPFAQIHFDRFF